MRFLLDRLLKFPRVAGGQFQAGLVTRLFAQIYICLEGAWAKRGFRRLITNESGSLSYKKSCEAVSTPQTVRASK